MWCKLARGLPVLCMGHAAQRWARSLCEAAANPNMSRGAVHTPWPAEGMGMGGLGAKRHVSSCAQAQMVHTHCRGICGDRKSVCGSRCSAVPNDEALWRGARTRMHAKTVLVLPRPLAPRVRLLWEKLGLHRRICTE